MIQTISPGPPLRGTVRAPGDKSISHRSALFGALAEGTTRVRGYSPAEDCASTLACLRALGVEVRREDDALLIEGAGSDGFREPEEVLPCGNSGTTMRLLLGALAGMDLYAVLAGDESLSRRPMDRVLEPLWRMGARYDGRSNGRYPPIGIRGGGNLYGIEYATPVASAQIKSALLLAGLRAEGPTVVTEPAPSRDHTERMLAAMGAQVEREETRVMVYPSRLRALEIDVPADPSGAAFLLAGALVAPGSEVVATDVCLNPTRTGLLRALSRMGAAISIEREREEGGEPVGDVRARSGGLQAVEVGGAEVPALIDELPLLAVLATQAEGRSVIRDAAELRIKETDRIGALVGELHKMGASIEARPDGYVVDGPTPLRGAQVDPHGDHRLAMALSVAALAAEGETRVLNAECVAVSYPAYWEELARLRDGED